MSGSDTKTGNGPNLEAGDSISPATEQPDAAMVKVLLVDDSQSIRRSASSYLATAGYHVITAEDGFEALSEVVKHEPDIIFADIMMPRLDGYQTCALIKSNADYQATPIVMLSSRDGVFDADRARLVGSDDHLSKPFTAESLIAVVTDLVSEPESAHDPHEAK